MTVYLVATTTPPTIVCPPWCGWDPAEHADDLVNWEGMAVHTGAYPFPIAADRCISVVLGQTLLPDGSPHPQERAEAAAVSVSVEGHELAATEALALGQHLIEVATAAIEGRAPSIPPLQEHTS